MRLIDGLGNKLCDALVKNKIVEPEDVEVYRYGLNNGITILLNILVSVLFGVITGRLEMVLVFLFFYGILRTYAGGMHCENKLLCFVCSIAILCFPVFSYQIFLVVAWKTEILYIGVAAMIMVLILCPVESRKKPLDDEERMHCRKVSHGIVLAQVCILNFMYVMEWWEVFYGGYTALILVAALMVLGKIKTKRYI